MNDEREVRPSIRNMPTEDKGSGTTIGFLVFSEMPSYEQVHRKNGNLQNELLSRGDVV